MFRLNSIGLCLSLGIVIGITIEAQAHSLRINSVDDFYFYYDPKNQYTEEQKSMVNSIFENVAPYFGEDGLENAIADGYIPFTPEAKGHGTHWFNPQLIDFTNIKANPITPAGLNFDENGKLVAVFWSQEKYQPILSLVQNLDLSNVDPATLPQLYAQYKQTTLQPLLKPGSIAKILFSPKGGASRS